MQAITTHDAKTHLSRYLSEVEQGQEFQICRGRKPVALLLPIPDQAREPRPKVGDIEGEPFDFPPAAFAPLTCKELKDWGL